MKTFAVNLHPPRGSRQYEVVGLTSGSVLKQRRNPRHLFVSFVPRGMMENGKLVLLKKGDLGMGIRIQGDLVNNTDAREFFNAGRPTHRGMLITGEVRAKADEEHNLAVDSNGTSSYLLFRLLDIRIEFTNDYWPELEGIGGAEELLDELVVPETEATLTIRERLQRQKPVTLSTLTTIPLSPESLARELGI